VFYLAVVFSRMLAYRLRSLGLPVLKSIVFAWKAVKPFHSPDAARIAARRSSKPAALSTVSIAGCIGNAMARA